MYHYQFYDSLNNFLEMNCSVLLFVLSTTFNIIIASTQSKEFVYKGNVSYSDVSLLISEAGPDDVSLRYFAAECYKNVDCNAVEICSFPAQHVCCLSRSITTALVSGPGTCFRYEIVRFCYIRNLRYLNLIFS